MSYELSDTDKYIVDMVNKDFGPEGKDAARKIHAEALAQIRPQFEALQRAVAMREYALAQLEDR